MLRVPHGAVRPTQDRVRAALFSILGARVSGARCLDLFAGTGALGLEAWSRGAASVCWVESHPRHLAVLRQNVHELGGPEAAIFRVDVRVFIEKGLAPGPYDIILCDPPYARKGPPPRAPRAPVPWLTVLLPGSVTA